MHREHSGWVPWEPHPAAAAAAAAAGPMPHGIVPLPPPAATRACAPSADVCPCTGDTWRLKPAAPCPGDTGAAAETGAPRAAEDETDEVSRGMSKQQSKGRGATNTLHK
jgi:hypothetical protein